MPDMTKSSVFLSVFLIFVNVFISIKIEAEGSEVCYNKYGCFNDEPPYNNDLTPLPRGPDKILTSFLLFTRETHKKTGEILEVKNLESLRSTTFKDEGKTVLIIHGFLENGLKPWVKDLVIALLTKQDISNVISVDWAYGASVIQTYPQAAANTRVVGAQVEELISWLCQSANASAESFHIIGSSLGAHVAGFAGKKLRESGRNLGRITGLDPAGPAFSDVDDVLRLDSSDASFVDVIHTDISGTLGGLGIGRVSGHLDFYPNGGDNQPSCKSGYFAAIKDLANGDYNKVLACSHNRAIYLFINSIKNSCQLLSYPCQSWEMFKEGGCSKCDGRCVEMGYNAEKYSDKRGKFYLETSGQEPFCLVMYRVTIYSSSSSRSFFSLISRPKVKLQVLGDKVSSPVTKINRSNTGVSSFIFNSPPLNQMKALKFSYRGFNSAYFYKVLFEPLEGHKSYCSRLNTSIGASFTFQSTVAPLEEGTDC